MTRLIAHEKLRIVKNARVNIRGERLDAMSAEVFAAALTIFEGADVNCCGGELGEEHPDLFTTDAATDTTEQTTTETLTETPTPDTTTKEVTETEEEIQEETPTEAPPKKNGFMTKLSALGRKLTDLMGED